jgi:hypothetical protein
VWDTNTRYIKSFECAQESTAAQEEIVLVYIFDELVKMAKGSITQRVFDVRFYVRQTVCRRGLHTNVACLTAKKDICGPYHSLNNFVYLLKIQGKNWMLRNLP